MIIDYIYTRGRAEQKSDKKSERHSRSIAKALSWRVIGTLDTFLISWLIAGDVGIAFSIGSIELLTKTVIYYLHERVWTNIKWGK